MPDIEYKPPSFKEAFDVAISVGNKVDVYWRQFFVVLLAFLGWITSIRTTNIDVMVAFGVSAFIVLFFVFNAVGLLRIYTLLIIAVTETSELARVTAFYSSMAREQSEKRINIFDYRSRNKLVILSHVFCAILLLILVWAKVI